MPEQDESGTWIEFMRKGEFEKAWKFSDSVLKQGLFRDYHQLPRHFQCIWDGTQPEGKRVLVRCYHGLGDTIQFIRYIPLLNKIAIEVIVWAQPRLLELLESAEGICKLIPLHNGSPEVEYDLDVEIMELPYIFRTTPETIPVVMPYLHADPVKVKGSGEFNVGLVWNSGDWDRTRSVPFDYLDIFFRLTANRAIILQDKADEAGWVKEFGVHPGRCSLMEHARIIAGLDLLITIDSMPAHLAGALNIPVWLMVPYKSDWRWMENRSDSPWYPSMRIFRQERSGEWAHVIEKVASELKILLERRSFSESTKTLPHFF
jgi:hypothetical protein